jgi:hypothetical protein
MTAEEKEFLLEFFGDFGRILGNPDATKKNKETVARYYTDNPNDIFKCIEYGEVNKLPAFISVQPFISFRQVKGIEKLFFDFDTHEKSEEKELTEEELERRKKAIEQEVINFAFLLEEGKISIVRHRKIHPLILKTRKGFHVYIYFDKVYGDGKSTAFMKEVYAVIMEKIIEDYEKFYKKPIEYLDTDVTKDIHRFGRVPFSIHEKSGRKVVLMKYFINQLKLEEDVIHPVSAFRDYSLKEEDMIEAYHIAENRIGKKEKRIKKAQAEAKVNWENKHGYVGKIRPCFQKAFEAGKNPPHEQRLAMLREAWYADIKDIEGLINLYRNLYDFREEMTRYQCQYFIDNEGWRVPPDKCETMQKKGWCIYGECERYRRLHDETKQKEEPTK